MIPREAPDRSTTRQRLFQITVPGLSVKRDASAVRARLRADFEGIDDVLATTMPETLLIVYTDRERVDEWLAALSDAIHRRSDIPRRRQTQARLPRRAQTVRHRRTRTHPSPSSTRIEEAPRSTTPSPAWPPAAA
jgi:hypothetical protein